MIRPRSPADLVACAAALRTVHETDRYPRSWPEDPIGWLRSPRQRNAWVAVDDESADSGPAGMSEIAGHIALNVAEGDATVAISTLGTGLTHDQLIVVSRLFVVPSCRRRGLAGRLLDHAVAHAHSFGLRPVLDVLESDAGPIAFYEGAGWDRVGAITFHSRHGEPLPAYIYAGPQPPQPQPPQPQPPQPQPPQPQPPQPQPPQPQSPQPQSPQPQPPQPQSPQPQPG
jgi:GNAT superfamily N-acetyltransferase